MPELPDLVNIVRTLAPQMEGRRILRAELQEPVVLRLMVPGSFAELLQGRLITALERHGPFLHWSLAGAGGAGSAGDAGPVDEPEGRTEAGALHLVMHLMLAGRLRLAEAGQKGLPATAFRLSLDDGRTLHFGDDKKMGKVYLCEAAGFGSIPGYLSQGVDVTSDAFSFELFSTLLDRRRSQARVFIMDQSLLSAIGNAYADEILFEARIHPKAGCSSLTGAERRSLYGAIRQVLAWGTEEVEKAGRPLEDKVREHMKVRGRAGQACPRCGTIIRKAGVLGFDAFFCPRCQPDRAGKGIVDWTRLPKEPPKD